MDFSSLSLEGKTALVCGASGGIGKAAAELLAARGAKVIALARSKDKLDVLVRSLPGTGHKALVADLSDLENLKSQISPQLKNESVQILINNAGGPKGGPLHEADISQFQAPIETHLMASQLLMQSVLPAMKAAKYGRIINIISTSVKSPIPGLGVSNTVRGAMASWSKTLAGELGPFGITVNNVLPGYIRTDRFNSLKSATATTQNQSEDQIEETWKKTVPVQRIGEPRDMAEAVCFLASPAASYISGINVPVDGGRTPVL